MRITTKNENVQSLAHIMSRRVLVGIFLALIGLTGATVAAARFDTGRWDVWIALGIATVKAILVAAYYMHLRYDRPIHLLILLAGLGFMTLFLGLTMIDVAA